MGIGMGWHHIVLADLPGSQRHFGVLGLAELCQLMEDGRQLICQRGVTATQLVLQCHTTMAQLRLLAVRDGFIPNPSPTQDGIILHSSPTWDDFILHPSPMQPMETRPKALKWALFDPSVVTQHQRGEIIKIKR